MGVVVVVLLFTLSVDSLTAHLMQTWFAFEQDVINAVNDEWHNRLRSYMHGSHEGHFKHML